MLQAIKSRRVVTPEGIRPATVCCEERKITAIEPYERRRPNALELFDLVLLPGLVDSHVHINEPGRTEWEGFETATRAAAAGGYTCLIDMPLNSIPATTDVAALTAKRQAAQGKCLVDYGFWGGVVAGNQGHIAALADAGVLGFKSFLVHPGIEEFTMVTERDLHLALPFVAQAGLPLLVHAELPGPIEAVRRALANEENTLQHHAGYLDSRPPEAEIEAIELMIRLSRQHQVRVHIVHLSSAEALPALRRARAEGLPVTVETCPHYLYFAAERIPSGATQFKCAPPIRDAANREALWNALRNRDIDLVATDHSPCPPELKKTETGDFRAAWGGIASLSIALAATWTAAQARGFGLDDLARWMSLHPARLAGLAGTKGAIAPGYDADFCVFDPNANWQVQPTDLHFRHPISPYVGESLRGHVLSTFVRGQQVFHAGRFLPQTVGREVAKQVI